MKFKDIWIPLSLALLTTWALQYFIAPQKQETVSVETKSGQRFTAPKATEVEIFKPLNTEVDFIDEKMGAQPIITSIETENTRYKFSTEGASLESVEFLRNWGGQLGYLSTVSQPAELDREKRFFLVALNEKTPYHFSLVNQKENEESFMLTYEVKFSEGLMRKQFTIFKHEHRIDLELTVQPTGESLQPRVFFGSPLVAELSKETVSAVLNDEHNKVQVLPRTEELLSSYWSRPTLIGSQDRYFVHALVKDEEHFAQRGYFKIFDLESLYAVLEGPAVVTPTTWHLSFYIGPKLDVAMQKVDSRLEYLLNYGWLAPISRPISNVLLDILDWLYQYFKNYGVAIIVLTVLMKLMLLPFTYKTSRGKQKVSDLQKKMKHIEEKYKNDKQALMQARAGLLRKQGLGLSGCLPLLLLQAPLFIALSWVLSNSIELYKAPFLWITDLSSKDPYYILPILLAVIMLFYNPTKDPTQRVTAFVMALVFSALTASLPAGLTLYLLVSTALGILQTALTK